MVEIPVLLLVLHIRYKNLLLFFKGRGYLQRGTNEAKDPGPNQNPAVPDSPQLSLPNTHRHRRTHNALLTLASCGANAALAPRHQAAAREG